MDMVCPRIGNPQPPIASITMVFNLSSDSFAHLIVQQHDWMLQTLAAPLCQEWFRFLETASVATPTSWIALKPRTVNRPGDEECEWLIVHFELFELESTVEDRKFTHRG